MFVSVNDLQTNKIENDKDFFIAFYNARDFGEVYCDNYTFETEVKNDPKDGGLTCLYTAIIVEAEEGLMLASFSEKGCTSKLFLTFGNVYLDGSNTDLSAFGTDLTNWRNIRYLVADKNVKIFMDNKEVYQLSFERNIGKIICISYYFYGCGSVRLVKLSDKNDKIVFEENFWKEHPN